MRSTHSGILVARFIEPMLSLAVSMLPKGPWSYELELSVLGAIRNHENVKLDVIYDCNSEHRERLENPYQDFLQSKIAAEV
jgi:hypothetical protein